MSTLMKQAGFSYAFDPSKCAECEGRCCTGESGYIYINQDEINKIAAFLKMNVLDFMQQYLYKNGYKFSLKEKIVGLSNDCVFFDRSINGCSIYEARPSQCRTFPFWDYFKTRIDDLKRECPGIQDV